MPLILYSRCCSEGLRYQGGLWPSRCPQCGKACQWIAATVEDPCVPLALTAEDARFLHALTIDPEVLEEV